jgi:hypothetical protein
MKVLDGYSLEHLARLSDGRGLFEHAEGLLRREEHGYCTDDNARLLVVASRESDIGIAHRLGRLALRFVLEAQSDDGRCRNRMDVAGRWTDAPTTDDCWGRSLWGLGSAGVHHPNTNVRRWALQGFNDGAHRRSPWRRAMAFAALGAADVLLFDPDHAVARHLLGDALVVLADSPTGERAPGEHWPDGYRPEAHWPWPEARLSYANAAIAEAIIAAGAALGRDAEVERGLALLGWLLELESRDGHLSVVGSAGRGPRDTGPQFDQQPIEVAALADACWRAYSVTGDRSWTHGIELAGAWFRGDNDASLPMFDEHSSGGFDGLEPASVNRNEGAESTLAYVSTMQRLAAIGGLP